MVSVPTPLTRWKDPQQLPPTVKSQEASVRSPDPMYTHIRDLGMRSWL